MQSAESESSSASEPGPGAAAPSSSDPYRAWRLRGFRRFLLGHITSVVGRQMTSLAVGWEIYRRTHSPTLLGLVGLASAIPLLLFTIPSGQASDRFSRKKIVLLSQAVACGAAVGLALLSACHSALPGWPVLEGARHGLEWLVARLDHTAVPHVDRGIPAMLALLLVAGVARTYGWTARAALVPLLVPKALFSNAVAWNSSLFQAACAVGPALCGLLVAKVGYPVVYAIDAAGALFFIAMVAPIKVHQPREAAEGSARGDFLSGLRFVFGAKLVISTITLDLFAVLLGGATALLPVFAERLHVGAVGLGWLRSADALGAIAMSLLIAHLPPMKHAGRMLLAAVAAYGVAIVGFGLSPWYWLSFGLLFFAGVFDAVSVVVRHTLVQLATPEALRGRVSAVNNVFIGSSNEIGAFESGLTAGLFGPVASVVGGGIGTVLVVGIVAWAWPELRRFGRLDGAVEDGAEVAKGPVSASGTT